MSEMNISKINKVIALDIGNVCLKLRFEKCLEFFGAGSLDEVPAEFMKSTDMFEKGLINRAQWLQTFGKVTGNRFSDDELVSAWNMILGEEIPGMSELIRQIISEGFRVIFFSDTSDPHMMHIRGTLSFAHLISGGIFSYEVKAKKPGDAMYLAFEHKYGKPFFYADDMADNIEGGRRHCWHSYLFKSPEDMKKEFFNILRISV